LKDYVNYLIAGNGQQFSNDEHYDVVCEPDIGLGLEQLDPENVASSSNRNHGGMSQKENASSNPQANSASTIQDQMHKRFEPVNPDNLIRELKQKFSSKSRKKSNIITESNLPTGNSAKRCLRNT